MLTRLLCARRGSAARRPRAMAASELGSGEWWLGDFAKRLGSPIDTLRGWIRGGRVHARCVSMTSGARWVVWADEDECGFAGRASDGYHRGGRQGASWESGKTRFFFSGRCQGRWGPLVSGALAGRPSGGSLSVFRDGKTARSVEGGLPARQASGPPGKTVRAAAGSPPDLPATATDETVAKCRTVLVNGLGTPYNGALRAPTAPPHEGSVRRRRGRCRGGGCRVNRPKHIENGGLCREPRVLSTQGVCGGRGRSARRSGSELVDPAPRT